MMFEKLCYYVLSCLLLLASVTNSAADDFDAASSVFFEKRVRPVLVRHCYECHGDGSAESDLRVDSRSGLLRGGKRGAAIVAGASKQSLMILAINHADQLHMPPKSKIPTAEIRALTAWVDAGAPWPNTPEMRLEAPPNPVEGQGLTREQRQFWSFQTPRAFALPPLQGQWDVRSPVDVFVQHALRTSQLRPAPRATKRVLLRRASFDLMGLPPTIEEIESFVEDVSPDAFPRVLDRLLASPRYGERWGRHWLDVARYADSNGLDENLAYGNAFRYRDYVISAFNRDKPYDRFVIEQLAGDRLAEAESGVIEERITATGFLSLGAKMLAEDDPVKMQMDIVDEQLDTVGRAFMGLTLGCARCHDHKFDPISTAEYYSLAGIFKSTSTMENFKVVARWREVPLARPSVVAEQEAHDARIATQQQRILQQQMRVRDATLGWARLHVGDYLLAAARFQKSAQQLAQAEVYGDAVDAVLQLRGKRVEAENFARGNVRKDFDTYGAGIGVLVNQGQLPNFVEYDVNLEHAGNYQLEIRYAAAAARPCLLMVNGETVKLDAAGKVTGSWNPDGQRWSVEGFFSMKAGKNVVRIEHPRFFPHIDKLNLIPTTISLPGQGMLRPLMEDYHPRAQLIKRWVDYLGGAGGQSDALFAPWHAWLSGSTLAELQDESARFRDALIGDATVESLRELAQHYQDAFRRVHQDRSLKSSSGSKEKNDGTAFERAINHVLFDEAGPFGKYEVEEADYTPIDDVKRKQLLAEKQKLEKTRPQFPYVMAVSDGKVEDLRIHIRGSHVTLGNSVPRQFPRVLSTGNESRIEGNSSGRLALARWLTSQSHPLTARVMVNRIWQGHFGRGLVRSPDNFGRLGERPAHPHLLDFLAVRFVAKGWSLKAMHRLLMTSATWQMSTEFDSRSAAIDPENRLWWRMDRRRLEAELIRDSILMMGDSLDLSMGGTLLPTGNRQYVTSTANVDPVTYTSIRRSVYLPVVRSALYDLFQAFDFADPSYLSGQRQTTTVAPQALFLMNSQLVADQMRLMALRLMENIKDGPQRVDALFETALGRLPGVQEREESLDYIRRYVEALGDRGIGETNSRLQAWQSLCRAVVSANEFIYVE
ncbi:MAG: DUF1553 domain-containing protein [Planctomycetota bacterium]|nr:DUF1553 domain-containing protein [Planctomycetota bacterium]